MYQSIPLACLLIAVTACAESPTTPAVVDTAEQVATPPDTGADSEGVIEVVAVPKAAESTTVSVPQPGAERICRRERRTGTNRAVRVCRTQAEMDRIEIESKETFDELRRSQQEYKH